MTTLRDKVSLYYCYQELMSVKREGACNYRVHVSAIQIQIISEWNFQIWKLAFQSSIRMMTQKPMRSVIAR